MSFFASQLRRELSLRSHRYARRICAEFVESYGEAPIVVYAPSQNALTHGNFAGASYRAIAANPAWHARFAKVHTSAARSLPKVDRRWRELDSSMSSDALLMNIFCYPGVADSQLLASMLGLDEPHVPEFGVKARVPLANGRFDRTEIDMRLGPLLVEAKLTESDFQCREAAVVENYRDFHEVFAKRALPRDGEKYAGYQLIRNVLAAHATQSSFCVMHDARRPDLRDAWYEIMQAVRDAQLRTRCKVLTWQELCPVLPDELRAFLDEKYGIVAPGETPSAIEPSTE